MAVQSLAYFNAKFMTGYILTQQDYVDFQDTMTNLKVILAASNEVADGTLIKNVSYGARMQFGTDTFTFWGLMNMNNLSNNGGVRNVMVDNNGILKTSLKNEYGALLTQSSIAPPQVVSIDSSGDINPVINTLGANPVYTRITNGVYHATLAGAFPIGKTFYRITPRGTGIFFSMDRINDDIIEIITGDSIDNLDGQLNNTGIYIEVYQ